MAWFGDGDADAKVGSLGQAEESPLTKAAVACLECGRLDALLRCSRCGVPYCSQECQRRAWKGHKAVCRQGLEGAQAASSSSAGASATEKPVDLRPQLTGPLRSGWQEYLEQRGAVRKPEVDKIKFVEAFGLAILQAVQNMPRGMPLEAVNGRCVVWVLGARDGIEKRQILLGGWEPLFASLDVGWDVVLVGPEMQEDPRVQVSPGRRIYTYACLTHEANMQEHLQRPSFICALNTGIGANVVHHMRSWIPTVGELLLLGRPVLFTCFGPHEVIVETQVFTALQANFLPHREGGFSYVLEPDKPMSVCNAMFTWVQGMKLSPAQLQEQAIPYVEAQLRGSELFFFLKEARSHLRILSDPEHDAHASWIEMYDGRFIPCLKQALEEDDDDRGGIQTIVRCTMKTVSSAIQNPLIAAVLLDMGAEAALASFKPWALQGHWTRHGWMLEEVTQRIEETSTLLAKARLHGAGRSVATCEEEPEEPFFCGFLVRAKAVQLRAEPNLRAPVVAQIPAGRILKTRAFRGVWLRAVLGDLEGWLLGYQDKSNVGDMTEWDILGWAR